MEYKNKHDLNLPEIKMVFGQDSLGRQYLTYDPSIFSRLAEPALRVRLVNLDGQERVFPIFQQNAMQYGDYSEYMKHHGCACCSLTTILAGMRRNYSNYMPQDVIANVERKHLPWHDFEKNYEKPMKKQMPISLYGISKILSAEGISHKYIGYYKNDEAYNVIARHLLGGNPVIFETSRIRYKNGWIRSVNDKKYAGSYHTMIMLGVDTDGKVVFTDSATRDWAGDQQRLKRADLEELMDYMFPQKLTEDSHVYFHRRKETGGFILVKIWGKEQLLKKIDNF